MEHGVCCRLSGNEREEQDGNAVPRSDERKSGCVMETAPVRPFELTDRDIEFIVRHAAPDFPDKDRLKRLLLEDPLFRKGLVGADALFEAVMRDETVFVRVSSPLFFEILLRRAQKDLAALTHTVERDGWRHVAVFDTPRVIAFLEHDEVVYYLAHMLSTFTRTESVAVNVRVRRGIWRRVHFNDMDVDSLMRFCDMLDPPHRFPFFKRIADVCLFTVGVFPERVAGRLVGQPSEAPATLPRFLRGRRTAAEYIEEGKRFYDLAARHPAALEYGLDSVFRMIGEHFIEATKPLNILADRYLGFRKRQLFGECRDRPRAAGG